MINRAACIVHGHYSRLEGRYAAQDGLRPAAQPPTIGILASAGLSCFLNTPFLSSLSPMGDV